jgi:hypothetical protein
VTQPESAQETRPVPPRHVAPIAAIVMIAVAALIWVFGTGRYERDPAEMAPLPECSPPRQNITI